MTLTAKATGASTNYSLASSSASGDPNTFGSSFSTTASGPTLTGGTPDTLTLVYDAGSLSVTVNGFTKTASYGQGSTGASIASVLAGAFNADAASPVVASSTGNVVNLATKATGSNTNYPLSTSSATSSQYFTSPSFSGVARRWSIFSWGTTPRPLLSHAIPPPSLRSPTSWCVRSRNP